VWTGSVWSSLGSGGLGYTPVNITGDTMTGDLIGTDFVRTRSGTITRSGGYISTIALTGGRTLTIFRTSGYISSATDGTRTWTYTRDINNNIISWSVT
jgi:hypothetical protein